MIKQEDSKLERTMTSAGGVRAVSVVGELWFPWQRIHGCFSSCYSTNLSNCPWWQDCEEGFGEFLPVTTARTPLSQLIEKTLAQGCIWGEAGSSVLLTAGVALPGMPGPQQLSTKEHLIREVQTPLCPLATLL